MSQINLPSQANNFIAEAVATLQLGDKLALLTLVAIEGSAPYPIGSQMLVRENGSFVGQITGGCAEVALAEQALVAIREGENQTHRYGLDSPYFDIQLPCGSGIDVYFDVLTPLGEYQRILACLESRNSAISVLKTKVGEFDKVYLPIERLALFGQGPILLSLAKLGLATGFEVLAYVQDEMGVDQLSAASIQSTELTGAGESYTQFFDQYTGVVSLFHEHERELAILQNALSSPCFYVGALGSRKTHQQRLSALRDLGVRQKDAERIFGPVGVNVGAETPAQIAVSILAQVIEKMPKRR